MMATKKTPSSMLDWQYAQILAQLDQVQLHASDPSCPCALSDIGEYCLAKHTLLLSSLAGETMAMVPVGPDAELLGKLQEEATEWHHQVKGQMCHPPVAAMELMAWARESRKKLEPLYYACPASRKARPPTPPETSPVHVAIKATCGSLALGQIPPQVEKAHEVPVIAAACKVLEEASPPTPPPGEWRPLPVPFGWPGGKRQLAKTILPLIPPHKTYVEPFAGAAAVFWHKPPSKVEVLKDLDPDLMRFYSGIGTIKSCPISELATDWASLKGKLGKQKPCEFLATTVCSFGNKRQDAAKLATIGYKACSTDAVSFHGRLPEYKERLKGVDLHNEDWESVVRRYDHPETFFYFDPPYHGGAKVHLKGEDQLGRLSQVLPTLKGKWLLTYDDHREVRQAFSRFQIQPVQSTYMMAANSNITAGKQLLIANYPLKPPTPPLSESIYKTFTDTEAQKYVETRLMAMSPQDRNMISEMFSGTSAYQLYEHLRSGDLYPDEEDFVKQADLMFQQHRLPDNIMAYRGILLSPNPRQSFIDPSVFRKGIVIRDRSYVSTSLSREVANRYAERPTIFLEGTFALLEIRVPKGTPFLPVSSYQRELILERDTRIRIISSRWIGRTLQVQAEVVSG